ncbi:hypothetical protein EUGRSUZ_L02194 [Eucalyptus grandis]|uniref:Uncharacterized protein n=1 Tax=Eucalyptus grandis TaxID=71139 RepID=A0A058ZSE2_EUCGR|nr:hypothetical protein EUGRSUZ_L02194 [Eucalyptus grandis]
MIISYIDFGRAREKALKYRQESRARHFFSPPDHQFPAKHSLLDSRQALLGPLGHAFLLGESVAPQVHLPARYPIHHSRV